MLKLTVIGNLGGDPEMRYAPSGSPILRFNVAANYRVKGDGGWEDRTEWCRVTIFGQRAESLSGLLVKGMRVYVEGRLEARPWTAQDGSIRAGLEMVAQDVEFMSVKNDDSPRRPLGAAIPAKDQGDDSADLPF
jgi:single-strand DNA-binding protein